MVNALIMALDLSEKVLLGLMSGPIRSGESSMLFREVGSALLVQFEHR